VKLGRHMPINAKPLQALDIAQKLGCETIQIFVNNPTAWKSPQELPPQPGKRDRAAAFACAAAERGLAPIVAHAPYLINLAASETLTFEKSVILLGETIRRAARFGARYVVFHVGSHRGAGLTAGIEQVAAGLRLVLPETPQEVMILLENDVGAGHQIGARIENLAAVLACLPEYIERLGICLDTAHLWGAGYNLGSAEEVERILADVEQRIGIHRLPVIHLNDTTTPLGGHRDLHARIGEGIIPQAGLRALLCHPALEKTAIILETPIKALENDQRSLDWAHDKEHLARVRALGMAGKLRSQSDQPAQ